MALVRIYIFRHGETDWNRENRLQGHRDIPLNETGKRQAGALAELLKKYKPQIILSSDLSRALETAQILTKTISVPVVTTQALRECNLGDSEGLLRDEVRNIYGDEFWQRWRSVHPRDNEIGFKNGETKGAHLSRMKTFIENFLVSSEYSRVAISTHGESLRRLVHQSRGAPLDPIPLPNSVAYLATYSRSEGIWEFRGLLE